jgi:hypothetical protein
MDLSHIPDVDVNKQQPVAAWKKLGELITYRFRYAWIGIPVALWRGVEAGDLTPGAAIAGMIMAIIFWCLIRTLWFRLTRHRQQPH